MNAEQSFFPVVLSGGSGTRLWPLSRAQHPKQFLPLCGDLSLLQQTLNRVRGGHCLPPIVMCSEIHRFMVAEQVQELAIEGASIVLEPEPKNTAPAIASAAWYALAKDPEAVLVVMPADHLIRDQKAFLLAIDQAVSEAKIGNLVTLGIVPLGPETGFGYIQVAKGGMADEFGALTVDRFVEKPDEAKAKEFIESGNFYWNAGIFVFKASVFLEQLARLQPAIHEASQKAVANCEVDLDFTRLDAEAYVESPNISVDYAVMEQADNVVMLPFNAAWSDIGSWDAVHQVAGKDEQGNASVGDVLHQGSSNSYAYASSRLVVTLGTENISVIETPDAVLVLDNNHAQSIKDVVEILKQGNRSEVSTHTTVYRPWGHYESLSLNPRFQVKRICVKPGAKLSLQKHYHRSEHWVVVSGTAIVTVGEEEILLSENESTYIPLGTMHRLYNPGSIMLELIEVQSGAYLGEDDIVRVGDVYGRS